MRGLACASPRSASDASAASAVESKDVDIMDLMASCAKQVRS